MKNEPIVIEQTYTAPSERVWKALTENIQMKQWYFELDDFKTEKDFEFKFYGGTEENRYLHLCNIKEVIPGRKISYSWKYDGYPGNSLVTFELFEEGNYTRIKLMHEGVEQFPSDNPDFTRENFVAGWTQIIGTALKDFVEKADKK
ncbi:MAG: SRPBCC domain-containing protein [Chitinophagales bacterium]